jgi:UvrD/REP helicase N-terminal domain
VEECQDVNPIQEAIVWLLHDLGARVCVVGDDDQTVCQWRASDVRNILTFATSPHPPAALDVLRERDDSLADQVLEPVGQADAREDLGGVSAPAARSGGRGLPVCSGETGGGPDRGDHRPGPVLARDAQAVGGHPRVPHELSDRDHGLRADPDGGEMGHPLRRWPRGETGCERRSSSAPCRPAMPERPGTASSREGPVTWRLSAA